MSHGIMTCNNVQFTTSQLISCSFFFSIQVSSVKRQCGFCTRQFIPPNPPPSPKPSPPPNPPQTPIPSGIFFAFNTINKLHLVCRPYLTIIHYNYHKHYHYNKHYYYDYHKHSQKHAHYIWCRWRGQEISLRCVTWLLQRSLVNSSKPQ